MSQMTSPLAVNGGRSQSGGVGQMGQMGQMGQQSFQGQAGRKQQQLGTNPMMMAGFAPAAEQAPTVTQGTATQYWDEALPIPAGPARLWLLTDNQWRVLPSPSSTILNLVQSAFIGTDSQVLVWYDGQNIVGLVVTGS